MCKRSFDMPAIQPARLKKQALDLAAKFDSPADFIRALHALLDHYSDHTHRSGQAGVPFPLISAYNTPPPVMRQVWVELTHQTKAHPEGILPLCDALWAEPNYDMRLLAARLLGLVSVNSPGSVLERLQAWIQTDPDERLLDQLIEYGLDQFQQNAPTQVLELASNWLASSDQNLQRAGMHLLLPMIRKSGIQNLPAIFTLITPHLRIAPSKLRPDILAVLTSLAHTSPSETAYILRQNLTTPDNPDTAWLIRQVINEFPTETRNGLKSSLKDANKRP